MSTVETATRPMTAEEFCDWVQRPENAGRHFELVRGEVMEMSRPGERHGVICGNVAFVLGLYTRQQRKGYVLSNDSGVLLERNPDTLRGPDVVFFRESRKYSELNPKFVEGLPALAVEVLSPNDHHGKVARRIHEFLQAGIRLVWIVDPEARDVTVYRPGEAPYSIEGERELMGEDSLPGFRCRVSEFFFLPGEEAEQQA